MTATMKSEALAYQTWTFTSERTELFLTHCSPDCARATVEDMSDYTVRNDNPSALTRCTRCANCGVFLSMPTCADVECVCVGGAEF